MIASIVWGIAIWQIYRTEFLAGFWGITNDEIAVVTIERDGGSNEDASTETIIIQDPSKSFWDGLQLLGVPLVLAVLGAWFQKTQQEQAERAAKEQREQDADETREEVLQLYFDRISTLLIDKNLMTIASKGDDATTESKDLLEASLDVIRARTLSILRRFEKDIDRKSSVVRFLAEAEIISKLKLNLEGANLNSANLNSAYLERANLNSVYLQKANLFGINLKEAKLLGANLRETNLDEANLDKANLSMAKLNRASLLGAKLNSAYLSGARFNNACLKWAELNSANLLGAKLNSTNLEGANLKKANLYRSKLNNADLSGANLEKANLIQANLAGANLTEVILEGANLNSADLSGANLEEANLANTNLVQTKLEGTDLKNVYFTRETTWPAKEEIAKAKNIPIELQQQLKQVPESHLGQPLTSPPSKRPQ